MSESEIPVNPNGDYHEEDDSKAEDILDSEVEQPVAIPNGMEWMQQILNYMQANLEASL